ncbi:MAG: prepilin peptidase [Candidatus Gracilibacteria bacterium]|nr:prepilin peptidase [Candidatus Gracilibacteria bacterium]
MLFILGTLFGSFASVLIHRLKSKQGGIMFGRSMCPNCKGLLKYFDLVPIFSYISTFGKCRYCKSKISSIYPFLEISTGLLFFMVGYNIINVDLIFTFNYFEIIKLFYFLFLAFITILIIFYDILFLEINEGVLLTGILGTALILILQVFIPGFEIISTLASETVSLSLLDNIGMVIVLFVVVGLLYIIMLKGLSEVYDILILILSFFIVSLVYRYMGYDLSQLPIINALFGVLLIFTFLFLQIVVSRGAWMGGGDLRIAILMGLVLGFKFSIFGLFATYIIGSIIGVGLIIIQKLKKKGKINTVIPFGPFLGMGLFACLLWKNEIENLIFLIYN